MAHASIKLGKDGEPLRVSRGQYKGMYSYKVTYYLGQEESNSGEKKAKLQTFDYHSPTKHLEITKQFQREIDKAAEEHKQRTLESIGKLSKGLRADTFNELVEVWWKNDIETSKMRTTTKDFYNSMLIRIKAYFGKMKIDEIKRIDVENFITSLKKEELKTSKKRLSTTSIQHHLNVLRIVLNYAEEHELILKNPASKVRVNKKGTKADKEQAHKKLVEGEDFISKRYLETVYLPTIEQNESMKYTTLFYFLAYEGLRRGELCALRWADIDFEQETITINKEIVKSASAGCYEDTPKSERSNRVIPLMPIVKTKLLRWREEQNRIYTESNTKVIELNKKNLPQNAFIFNATESPYEHYNPDSLTKLQKRIEKRNNLPTLSPHDLRHTFGSMSAECGVPSTTTRDWMGHEDTKTTDKFYTGTSNDALRRAAKLIVNE